jgi:hypothetical protein
LQQQLVKIALLQLQPPHSPPFAMQPVNQPSSIAAKEISVSVLQLLNVSQDYVTQFLLEHL